MAKASKTKSIIEAGEQLCLTTTASHRFNMKAGTPFRYKPDAAALARLKADPVRPFDLRFVPLPDPGAVDEETYRSLRLIDVAAICKREDRLADMDYQASLIERRVGDDAVVALAFGGDKAAFRLAVEKLGLQTTWQTQNGERRWYLSAVKAWQETLTAITKIAQPIAQDEIEKRRTPRTGADGTIYPGVPLVGNVSVDPVGNY